MLAGIADGYAPSDKIDRFGVKLIRNPALSEDELLLETCDSTIRTLYCDISSRDAISADLDVIETMAMERRTGRGAAHVIQTRAAARLCCRGGPRLKASIPEQTTTTIQSARYP